MTGGVIVLGPVQLAVAASLVVSAGALSLVMRLRLERQLAIAALRTVVQLGLVGLILERVFALSASWLVVAIVALMILFAAREAVARAARRYRGIWIDAWLAMAGTSLVVGGVVTQGVVGVTPWYDPQYVIPLLGMILGNSLNGIALCLDRFVEHLVSRTAEIELRLAFGATRSEALSDPIRAAVRTGLIPIINAMAAAGIVSLPGMMTGQILAGSPPMQAVAYQIVVMFMIAAASAFGAMTVAVAAGLRLTAPEGLLRLDRLESRR